MFEVLAQTGELQAERILFGVGVLAHDPEHLSGVRTDRRAAWRRGLFCDLDNSPRGGCRIEAAVLHAVESGCEGVEGFDIQIALLRRHPISAPSWHSLSFS